MVLVDVLAINNGDHLNNIKRKDQKLIGKEILFVRYPELNSSAIVTAEGEKINILGKVTYLKEVDNILVFITDDKYLYIIIDCE